MSTDDEKLEFQILEVYDNYIPAHIAMGRLSEEGITCWLKDENTVTIDPILTNAIGGIKLMVLRIHAEKAREILDQDRLENRKTCPRCGSKNVEFVTTPRKPANWLATLLGVFTNYALPVDKVHHCFDCGNEFEMNTIPG